MLYSRATIVFLVSLPVVVFKIEFVLSECQVVIFMPVAINQQDLLDSEQTCVELSATLIDGVFQGLRQTGA